MATITRVYDNYAQAQRVVSDLEAAGIASGDISLVANKYVSDKYANVTDASGAESGAGVGAAVGGGAGLLAGLGLLAIPGLGPVVAAGWLAATAVGAVAGAAAGGIIGAITDHVSEDDAHVYAESIRRGSTMITARMSDALQARAAEIMDRHAPIDPAARRAEYARDGWQRFDPQAPAYKPSQDELDRMRREYTSL